MGKGEGGRGKDGQLTVILGFRCSFLFYFSLGAGGGVESRARAASYWVE